MMSMNEEHKKLKALLVSKEGDVEGLQSKIRSLEENINLIRTKKDALQRELEELKKLNVIRNVVKSTTHLIWAKIQSSITDEWKHFKFFHAEM